LLPRAPRTAAGYRKFSEAAVERLAFVRRAKDLGFSLEEVRELLMLQDEHVDACAEASDLLKKKLVLGFGFWSSYREDAGEVGACGEVLLAALLLRVRDRNKQAQDFKMAEVCWNAYFRRSIAIESA
jgi:hypothetical protein